MLMFSDGFPVLGITHTLTLSFTLKMCPPFSVVCSSNEAVSMLLDFHLPGVWRLGSYLSYWIVFIYLVFGDGKSSFVLIVSSSVLCASCRLLHLKFSSWGWVRILERGNCVLNATAHVMWKEDCRAFALGAWVCGTRLPSKRSAQSPQPRLIWGALTPLLRLALATDAELTGRVGLELVVLLPRPSRYHFILWIFDLIWTFLPFQGYYWICIFQI